MVSRVSAPHCRLQVIEKRLLTLIDISSCILAELYTGVPIFPGENEHEQLACIMEVLGVPDRYLIEKASRRKNFFGELICPRCNSIELC